MLPNFLVIGAARAGTSSLWDFLRGHPQVFMSGMKETNFFALEGITPRFQGPGDEPLNHGAITDLMSYERLFEGVTHQRAVGEASTMYLYHPCAASRIKAYIPRAKIIVILRNPVDRAFSSYLQMIREGREPVRDFSAALRLEPERILAVWEHLWHYKTMGFYYSQLSRYYDLFESSNIRVYLFEDLVADKPATLTDLLRFLGVDEKVKIELKKLNSTSHVRVSRVRFIDKLLREDNVVTNTARRVLPASWVSRARNLFTYRLELAESVRRELVEVFREDIDKLETLINRDLSSWKALEPAYARFNGPEPDLPAKLVRELACDKSP
jgi:hypothetical protein